MIFSSINVTSKPIMRCSILGHKKTIKYTWNFSQRGFEKGFYSLILKRKSKRPKETSNSQNLFQNQWKRFSKIIKMKVKTKIPPNKIKVSKSNKATFHEWSMGLKILPKRDKNQFKLTLKIHCTTTYSCIKQFI